MSFTPKNNKYISPDKARHSVSSKRGSVLSTSGKRDSKILSNHVRRPSKLKSEDLKKIVTLPNKIDKQCEISKEAKKVIKTNKIGSSKNVLNKAEPLERVNLAVELEDPANEYLRVDIQKIMQMGTEVNALEVEYSALENTKNEMKDEVYDVLKKDTKKDILAYTANNCK